MFGESREWELGGEEGGGVGEEGEEWRGAAEK